MILIISHAKDEHTHAVQAELHRIGAEAAMLDLSDFPQQMRLNARYDGADRPGFRLLLSDGTRLDLGACRSAWWRRPQAFSLHPEIQDPIFQNFAFSEATEAFQGLWPALDVFWVNHPTRDSNAHRKVYQLQVAQQVGLTIPETLITNDPEQARAFVEAHGFGRTIYKAFTGTRQAWRETRLLKEDDFGHIESVRFAPVIFQRYVDAQVDLRITVVGNDLFPAAIHSQESSYKVDFRMDMSSARVEPHRLPPAVEDGLRALMEELGIVYGAVDMRLTPDGEYVFLEVNPAGQWLFIEARTGQPITTCLAHLLASQPK